MTSLPGKLALSGSNDGVVTLSVVDEISGIEFVYVEMDFESLGKLITGRSFLECKLNVSGLEHVGKKEIREPRVVSYNNNEQEGKKLNTREMIREWLITHKQEPGWYLDPYVGSKNSVIYLPDGAIEIRYFVYKYVDVD